MSDKRKPKQLGYTVQTASPSIGVNTDTVGAGPEWGGYTVEPRAPGYGPQWGGYRVVSGARAQSGTRTVRKTPEQQRVPPPPPPPRKQQPGGRQIIPKKRKVPGPPPLRLIGKAVGGNGVGGGMPLVPPQEVRDAQMLREKPEKPEELKTPYTVSFDVGLGGLDFEPYEAVAVTPSLQVRLIPPGATGGPVYIPILIVDQGYIFRLESIFFHHYSEQGRQDLRVQLFVGRKIVYESGRLTSTNPAPPFDDVFIWEEPVAQTADYGIPYSIVSRPVILGGTVISDNYAPAFVRTYALGFEKDAVYFSVQNQSQLYSHGIGVGLYGWLFPNQGRSKCEVYREMVT